MIKQTINMFYDFKDLPPTLEKVVRNIVTNFPKVKIINKRSSLFWRIVNFLLRVISLGKIHNGYVFQFSTTQKNFILLSDEDCFNLLSKETNRLNCAAVTLAHELVHLKQINKLGRFIFYLLYLTVGRAFLEKAAYLESLRTMFSVNKSWAKSEETLNYLTKQFTGASYLWMWPFPKTVKKWFTKELERLEQLEKLYTSAEVWDEEWDELLKGVTTSCASSATGEEDV